MRIRRFKMLYIWSLSLAAMQACKPAANNLNQGFTLTTTEVLQSSVGGLPGPAVPLPGQSVDGTLVGQIQGAPGSIFSYNGQTSLTTGPADIQAAYYVSNGIAPSAWDHSVAFPIACAQGAVPPVVFEGTQFGSNIFFAL